MIDLYQYDGKKVKVICDEGQEFLGVGSVDTDYDSQRDYIEFDEGAALRVIYADEIKSIEIIE